MAESLRFLEEGSSAPSKSGAKVRPKGVADAQTVDIPSVSYTHLESRDRWCMVVVSSCREMLG